MNANSSPAKRSRKSQASDGSKKPRKDRPKKPYARFPLTPHASGKWQKKMLEDGKPKTKYFGRWANRVDGKLVRIEGDGWEEALREFEEYEEDLRLGRPIQTGKNNGLSLYKLCNKFLESKAYQLKANELSRVTFEEYRKACKLLTDTLGKDKTVEELGPADFTKLHRTMIVGKEGEVGENDRKPWGPVRRMKFITLIRSIFKYGLDSDLYQKPMKFGPEFKKPSAEVLDRERAASGEKMFEASEIRALLKESSGQMKAIILLGINCGFGNKDIADLPKSAMNLEKGWHNFSRPKTGVARRCRLWPETAKAIKDALAVRPEAKDKADDDCVFLTKFGHRYSRISDRETTDEDGKVITAYTAIDRLPVEFSDLLKEVKIKRKKIGYYTLRHTFRTVADEVGDLSAIRKVMGHKIRGIDGHYIERISDERLCAVSDHVHKWLYGVSMSKGGAK